MKNISDEPSIFGPQYDDRPYVLWPSGIAGVLRRYFGLHLNDVVVLFALLAQVDRKTMKCSSPVRVFCEDTGLLHTQVKRSLIKMKEAGILKIIPAQKKGRPGFGSPLEKVTNHYDLGALRLLILTKQREEEEDSAAALQENPGIGVAENKIEKLRAEIHRLEMAARLSAEENKGNSL